MASQFSHGINIRWGPVESCHLCFFPGPGERHVLRIDHRRIPQQALYWEVPGFKRGPGRPRANWIGTVKEDLRKMTLTWEEAEVELLTDKNGVGVWPNASTWMRVESRSRSRSRGPVQRAYHRPTHALLHCTNCNQEYHHGGPLLLYRPTN